MHKNVFVKNCLKKSNLKEQKKYKHIFTAIILNSFNEPYEYFTSEEFKGAFILDSTVDEMVDNIKLQMTPSINLISKYSQQQQLQTKVDPTAILLFLIIGIYSEIFYLLQKNHLQFNKSFQTEAAVLLEHLLFHSSNYLTCRKIKALLSLFDEDCAKLGKTEIAEYCIGMMKIFMDMSEHPYFHRTFDELMQRADNERITSSNVWQLFKKNNDMAIKQ